MGPRRAAVEGDAMNAGTRLLAVAAALGCGFALGARMPWKRRAPAGSNSPGAVEAARRGNVSAAAVSGNPTDLPVPAGAPDAAGTAVNPASELLARIAPLVEASDGRGLLRLARRLAALGEPGFPGVIEILSRFLEVKDEEPPPFGVTSLEVSRLLFKSDCASFVRWLYADPTRGNPAVRRVAVLALYFNPDLEGVPVALSLLQSENDVETGERAARVLREAHAADLPAMAAAARAQHGHPSVVVAILRSMTVVGGVDAWAAIEPFASDGDPAVSAAARVRLRQLRPPVAGVMVTDLPKAATSGLRPGDIIISWDGVAVSNAAEVSQRLGSAPPGTRVNLVVHRDDGLATVELDAPVRDIRTESVAPSK